jgi:outer membrane autotransporter protein
MKKWSLSYRANFVRLRRSLQVILLSSAWLTLWLFPSAAHGQGSFTPGTFWDKTTGGPGGTWDTSSSFWSPNSAGGSQYHWADGTDAVFSATGLAATGNFTVTQGLTNLDVGNLTYRGGNAGSILAIVVGLPSDTLTMANATMNVAVDPGTFLVIYPAVAGAGNLVLQSGTLFLLGTNTYAGGTVITGGSTLAVDNDGELGDPIGAITLQGGKLTMNTDSFSSARPIMLGAGVNVLAALDTTDFRSATFSGLITGTGALTVGDVNSSTLTVTLSNPLNSYSGGTTITGGATVELDTLTDSPLGSGSLTLAGGTLLVTLDGFTSSRAITLFDGNAPSALAAGFASTATFSGIISGSGRLTIDQGTVVLSGTNLYSGGTTVANARVMVSHDTNFGAPFSGITLAGGEIVSTLDGFSSPRPILLVAGGDFQNILAAADGTTGTYSGVVSGDSPLQIGGGNIPDVTGKVVLSGVNTYTGGTLVTTGAILSIGDDSALGMAGTGITLAHGELLTTATFSTTRPITLEQFSTLTNTLAAQSGTTMTYNGIISSNGPLEIGDGQNAGTVIFTANNTYVGDTSIFPFGVLSIDKNAELGDPGNGVKLFFGGELLTSVDFVTARSISLDPPIVGPAGVVNPAGAAIPNVLAAAPGTTATYTGLVFGTGGLSIGDLKGNSGTVILTDAANSYTGGTTVQGGATLSVPSDPVLGNPNGGLILRGGEFLTTGSVFNSARAITVGPGSDILAALSGTRANYSGVLSNIPSNGGVLLIGDPVDKGTVILSGHNTYSGGTILQAGILLVNNAQALGTGNVLVSGGVLAADPQPINVVGNYVQNAAGTLQLSVAGRAAGQFDTLNVGGAASLNGTLALINLGYQPVAGDTLKLVSTGGVVTGKFATFQNPFTVGRFNTVDLIYARQSVTLEFLSLATPPPVPPVPPGVLGKPGEPVVPGVPGVPAAPGAPVVIETTDFSSFAFTPNQGAAASLLDAVQLNPKAANLISFLNQVPFANLTNDLDKISPADLTAFYEIGFSTANIQKLTLESRLDNLHSGSSGFSSNMQVNSATLNNTPGPDGKSSKAAIEPVLQQTPENHWGVWVTGFGDFVNVDGDGNAKGYNFTTGGVSVGVDFRIIDHFAVGVMGDYSHTWTSLKPGHIDVNSGRGGVYASWFDRGFYVNGAIYGGHDNYDSNRSGLGGAASGSTQGSEWSTFIGGGYDFHLGSLTVGPVASLQYTEVGIDDLSERGSVAPLNVHSGSAESLRSDAGFRLFYRWQIGKVVLEPSLKAAWEHEYKYSALPVTAGFAGVPGSSATFFGPNEGHDSALVSAGVTVALTPAISTYVSYDGQLGRGNYDSNAVTGGFAVSF